MSLINIRRVLTLALFSTLLAGALPATAIDSGHYLAGLGLHEETGRQIYLGGLYLPNDIARPADISTVSGDRIMEYRVVARRTSIRSLLGGMLLQSEIATGNQPGPGTTELADVILSSVKSSLYAGDSFAISTDGASQTSAILNGTVVATVDDPGVADYLMKGWVSENGPTTAFRRGLTSESIDPGLRSILDANTASEERRQDVASWVTPQEEPVEEPVEEKVEEQVAAAPEPKPEPKPEPAPVKAAPAVAATAAAAAATATAAAPAPAPVAAAAKPQVAVAEPAPAPTPAPTPVAPAPAPAPAVAAEDDIMTMDVQEYSRRLAEFHGNMVAKVYRQIKYPKRAVRRNLQGRLELDLALNDSGKFESVVVSQSSGHKLLDNAALDAAERAFASKPVKVDAVAMAEFGADESTLIIPIPVSFKLAE